MSATLKLLEKYRAAGSIPSDNAAAIALGIHRATVSGWRKQGKQAEPHVIAAMAKAIGQEPGGWLALIESERARSSEDKKVWAALARQLGAAAAVVLMLSSVALPSTANASQGFDQLHIMRSNGS
ncbi:DUF3693 domain-containing protein [Pseudomonas sp. CGJS7]|uniref:DUF3693 domain-containing protein n=1 Tax=Pseudomonas sp. CGJS7 TaxID=3109348 RepID=UPI00300BEC64